MSEWVPVPAAQPAGYVLWEEQPRGPGAEAGTAHTSRGLHGMALVHALNGMRRPVGARGDARAMPMAMCRGR